MEIGVGGELTGLFFAAVTAATILPGASEAVLAAVVSAGSSPVWLALTVATIGNTLGSVVNWGVGRFLAHYRPRRWFPIKADQFEAYVVRYQRFGVWSLLLAWVPIIGDPLTVISGVLRTPLWVFVPLVGLVKFVRYLLVLGVVTLF